MGRMYALLSLAGLYCLQVTVITGFSTLPPKFTCCDHKGSFGTQLAPFFTIQRVIYRGFPLSMTVNSSYSDQNPSHLQAIANLKSIAATMTKTNVNGTSKSVSFKVSESAIARVADKNISELAGPLLDVERLQRVIAEWSRPLPKFYISRPIVLVGPRYSGKAATC